MLTQLLSANGYHTAGVSHGAEAARLMRQDAPDLIVIDQDVPIGGFKTAQIIRLNPRYGRVPILMGIGAGTRPMLEQAIKQGTQAGISRFLIRPYDPQLLLQKIRGSLDMGGPSPKARGENGGSSAAETSLAMRRQIRELTDLPMLSVAQQRVISIMSEDDANVNVDELVSAIQSDQALTMRIMRTARSAYYGFTGNFARTAITFLGMPRVRQVVQSATVIEVFKGNGKGEKGGLDRTGAWAHSVACGMVMQMLSRDNKQARHFTIGLLHDVGKLVMDFKFHEYSQAILEVAEQEKRSMHEVEKEMVGISHAEIGHELANLWQLPNEVAESIAYHHEPSRAFRNKYLSSLVYLADIAVRKMEIGNSGNLAPPEVKDPYALKLHVPMEEVFSHRDELAKQVEAIVSTE